MTTPSELKTETTSDIVWGKDAAVQGGASIKVVNNNIYYYAGVTHKSILELTEQIQIVSKKMRVVSIENDIPVPPIKLHIGSYGGSVFAGFAGMDMIKNNSVPITTIVDGAAASAATLLSVVGNKRCISKNSYMLIHQLSSFVFGKFEEIKDTMENLEKLMNTIRKTYLDHARIPKDELDELLKHDLWLTADQCLKYGLVDEIVE
jgi:ATP-dependent Clp protease protease subunit